MILKIVAIKPILFLLLILFSFKGFTQTVESDFMKDWEIISVNKDTIYLKFKDDKNCPWQKKFYSQNEKGIIFNIGCKFYGSCLFSDKFKADTLCYKYIKDYKISTMQNISKKIKDFRTKTYKKRPKSNDDKLFQAYDNNDIFKTYIIEVLNDDKFVIYPVIWRNQRIER